MHDDDERRNRIVKGEYCTAPIYSMSNPTFHKSCHKMLWNVLMVTFAALIAVTLLQRRLLAPAAVHPKSRQIRSSHLLEKNTPCVELFGQDWNINSKEVPCRVPVALYPYLILTDGDQQQNTRAVVSHLMMDGIQESSVLHMASDMLDMDPNIIWVAHVDVRPSQFDGWCDTYYEWVQKAQEHRAKVSMPLQWPIFIVDYTNDADKIQCKQIEQAVGLENVHYVKRSLVENRSWNETTEWVNVGQMVKTKQGVSYRHAPYPVRNDIVQALEDQLKQLNMSLSDPIETLPRPLDVVHLWPTRDDTRGIVWKNSGLRSKVGTIINTIGHEHNVSTFVGLKGEAHRSGRQSVSQEYIETLLTTKIFMVVQRDTWEDHWRLLEAMVGGSLVLTDRMLGLPLVNGTHLVEFTSEQDLRNKILYYLQHPEERLKIARQGREMAMAKHRAWHRMEEIVFGHSITGCSLAGASEQCPFTVKP